MFIKKNIGIKNYIPKIAIIETSENSDPNGD